MLIQLAPEYWMEIFDFLIQHRRVVAEKISQFGDRQFSDLCQHWLHERTKNVHLNDLIIQVKIQSTGVKSSFKWITFAEVPMPENIVGFKRIVIKGLNSEVLNFLRRMSSLFTNIRLNIGIDSDKEEEADAKNALVAFEHLLPLFNGINQIYMSGSRPFFERFRKQFPSALLDKAGCIQFGVTEGLLPDDFVQFIAHLLHTNRENGDGPRRCAVIGRGNGAAALAMSLDQLNQLLAIIREKFLGATTPTSFIFAFRPPINNVQQFHIENGNTGEKLVVLKNATMLLIIRCPFVDVKAWIRQQNFNQSDRVITIFSPEIGELNEEEDSKEQKEEYEEESDDQPGPSKKMKLT